MSMDRNMSYEQVYREVMQRPLPSEGFVVPREAPSSPENDPYERLLIALRQARLSGELVDHEI